MNNFGDVRLFTSWSFCIWFEIYVNIADKLHDYGLDVLYACISSRLHSMWLYRKEHVQNWNESHSGLEWHKGKSGKSLFMPTLQSVKLELCSFLACFYSWKYYYEILLLYLLNLMLPSVLVSRLNSVEFVFQPKILWFHMNSQSIPNRPINDLNIFRNSF